MVTNFLKKNIISDTRNLIKHLKKEVSEKDAVIKALNETHQNYAYLNKGLYSSINNSLSIIQQYAKSYQKVYGKTFDPIMYFSEDLNIWLPIEDSHFEQCLKVNNGRYQPLIVDAAIKHTKNKQGMVLDIGAHAGLISREFAAHFKEIYSFEPQPNLRTCLMRNTASFNNVVVLPFALGDKEEEAQICAMSINTGGSYIVNKDMDEFTKLVEERTMPTYSAVKMRTIDSFNFQNVALIKIDVQGFEYKVLSGAKETIAKWKPTLILETANTVDKKFNIDKGSEIKSLIRDLGYDIIERVKHDAIYRPIDEIKS